MGWASGSGVAERLWVKIRPYIKEEDYGDVTKTIVDTFEEYDADDWIVEPWEDCLYYVYLRNNNPKELEEYEFD